MPGFVAGPAGERPSVQLAAEGTAAGLEAALAILGPGHPWQLSMMTGVCLNDISLLVAWKLVRDLLLQSAEGA